MPGPRSRVSLSMIHMVVGVPRPGAAITEIAVIPHAGDQSNRGEVPVPTVAAIELWQATVGAAGLSLPHAASTKGITTSRNRMSKSTGALIEYLPNAIDRPVHVRVNATRRRSAVRRLGLKRAGI